MSAIAAPTVAATDRPAAPDHPGGDRAPPRPAARPADPTPRPPARGAAAAGLGFGLIAVAAWAGYLAFARLGVSQGLEAPDVVFLRFVPAGLVMLPVLVRAGLRDLGGVGWARGAALTLAAGPLFIALGIDGFHHASLATGAVIQPASATLSSLPLAWALVGARPAGAQVAAAAVVLAGLAMMLFAAGAGPGVAHGAADFIAGGALWALYTVLLRRWSVGAAQATAIVAVFSALVAGPAYLAATGGAALLRLDPATLAAQVVVQGLGAGVIALLAFGRAVTLLGPSQAAMITALVPGAALAIGAPVTGEIPAPLQIGGALVVTAGVLVAIVAAAAAPSRAGEPRPLRPSS
jgi:drug/metabolite transporter (DMT)-like permease